RGLPELISEAGAGRRNSFSLSRGHDRRGETLGRERPVLSSTRKGLLIAVKLVLASALLAWIGLSGRFPWSSFARLAEPSALRLLAVAGACVVLSQLVAAWRWRLLLAPSRLELSLGSLFAVNYVGLLFNNFILGGQGGDLVRIGLLGRAFPEQKADA